ncbi:hypothetical protein AKJ65_04120 [candidate division MSBL1 archaeon SCGC-AAA259E19]|uniref:Uncharacterized protein n=1 Tax=candidate division MSBL1 archaeon SCGC-AAA259E19 TaxID=1698264 RepID=A0A133UKA1_9EURY|nr:hypothetical protein AKJ65_04120 [candidate division MSBL1 archaeon SCGC-AAA259E19]
MDEEGKISFSRHLPRRHSDRRSLVLCGTYQHTEGRKIPVIKTPAQDDVQWVIASGKRNQEAIREMKETGEEPRAEIQYLSKGEGSLRNPSFKRLSE